VPKSRVRKKAVYTPPAAKSAKHAVSPMWLAPTMVGCLMIGLAWIALYYVTQADMPLLSSLGGWNLVCGFGLIVAGVVLATRWH
jgi:hypothetical protein